MAELTIKQENFCKVYVEIGNASEAYRQAYTADKMKPETINRAAKELTDNPKIATRVKELQQELQDRHNFTVDGLSKMYVETYELARGSKQTSSMNGAVAGIAKLHGLATEDRKNDLNPIGEMADDEIERRIAELEGRTRGAPSIAGGKASALGQGKPH